MTRNARDFDFLASALEKNYRILCPDAAGRGKSDWLENPLWYGYPTYVGDMFALFAQRSLTQVDWVGTSMGGLTGMMIAAAQPQIIRRLVINDIGPFLPKEALARLATYVGQVTYFMDEEEAFRAAKIIYAPWGIADENHLRHIVQHSLRRTEKGLAWHYDPAIGQAFREADGSLKKMEDADLWAVWEKVKCPVLLLRGAESDLLSAATTARMKEMHPAMEIEEYPGIGHAPALMDEAQIGRVKSFLLVD
jgi:pimeloyl-ACP methyl ester carboxylesterase